jgi:hypothetical protein
VIYGFYTASGYSLAAVGLSPMQSPRGCLAARGSPGGAGLVVGDLFGGLIEEMIQTLISQTLTSFNALSGFS